MVNWTKFEQLPGDPRDNFESLCRSIIRLHYGPSGDFGSLANQPGVEFHLKLHEDCELGKSGRWLGWQCKWYDLPKGTNLRTTRRNQIEEAIRKTEKCLPKLTDWILWTRHKLTKADDKWFREITTKMHLDSKTSEDVEMYLMGPARHLRESYFGDLILTPERLDEIHSASVAGTIEKRWIPQAHQSMHTEHEIRRMLGEADSWEELIRTSTRLQEANEVIAKEPKTKKGLLSKVTPDFINHILDTSDRLSDIYQLFKDGEFDLLRLQLESHRYKVPNALERVPRLMRGARLECGLYATNALADLHHAVKLLKNAKQVLGMKIVGVVAEAGAGKTQLSAELTKALDNRPAGVLLQGKELHSGRTLDDLARNSVKINGIPVPSIDTLCAALDAAGERSKNRIPLVIDGLNEAEDPVDWKDPLAALTITLAKYPNVLVICTVRPGVTESDERNDPLGLQDLPPVQSIGPDFAQQSLPDGVQTLELFGFEGKTEEAIEKYFEHYLIDASDADLPTELLSHPLTLRIFCEVTNPDRKKVVGVESIPGSLAGLLGKYIDQASERVASLAPRLNKFYEHDVRQAIDIIGAELWEKRTRVLPAEIVMKEVGDDKRPWDKRIIHLLEQEGLILFVPGDKRHQKNIVPVHDAMGGQIIADSILNNLEYGSLETWLKSQEVKGAFNYKAESSHPLATDIFRALVDLVPRKFPKQQVWEISDEPLQGAALLSTTKLEGKLLDSNTVSKLSTHIRENASPHELLRRLYHTRSSEKHPLNAEFLDSVLRGMSVSERDLKWTEWVRDNAEDHYIFDKKLGIFDDIIHVESKWKNGLDKRTSSDRLRAIWLMWLLTTTIHSLRDHATRAIYWFGRGAPTALFDLTISAAEINDPYIFERMLAASYGVSMNVQHESRFPEFAKKDLVEFCRSIYELFFAKDKPSITTHVLAREYASRMIELCLAHNPEFLSKQDAERTRHPFINESNIPWEKVEIRTDRKVGKESPFRMDFENYTLGSLAEGRGNYNYDHEGYQKIRSQVLWRIEQFGWEPEKFSRIDESIASERYNYNRHNEDHFKIDRYGKKYSWIAHHELKGWLIDKGLLSNRDSSSRTWDVDIDPSYPKPTEEINLITADFLGDSSISLREWITDGPTPDLTPYLKKKVINNLRGPWVSLDGYVAQEDEKRGRRMFAFLRSFLVLNEEANEFAAALRKQDLGGRWLPEKPATNYAFSGELPWSSIIPNIGPQKINFVPSEKTVLVEETRTEFLLDGKLIGTDHLIQLPPELFKISVNSDETNILDEEIERIESREVIEEVERVEQEFKELEAILPVLDFSWEGRSAENEAIHGISLARELAQNADLIHLPQTHDLQTTEGVRATYGITWRPDDWNNSHKFFYIRRDILKELLSQMGMSLIWAIWGERELSYKQHERARPGGDLEGLSHANFKQIVRFR